MIPAEKIPEPWPSSLAGRHHPLYNGPAGGWRTGRNLGASGAQRGDFFLNQARNSPLMGSNPGHGGATRKPFFSRKRRRTACHYIKKKEIKVL
jgi:hypothetical protein